MHEGKCSTLKLLSQGNIYAVKTYIMKSERPTHKTINLLKKGNGTIMKQLLPKSRTQKTVRGAKGEWLGCLVWIGTK